MALGIIAVQVTNSFPSFHLRGDTDRNRVPLLKEQKKNCRDAGKTNSKLFISSLHLLKQYPRRWIFLQYNIPYSTHRFHLSLWFMLTFLYNMIHYRLWILCTMRSRLTYECATFRNYANRGYRLSIMYNFLPIFFLPRQRLNACLGLIS